MEQKIVEITRDWKNNVVNVKWENGGIMSYEVKDGMINEEIFRHLEIAIVTSKCAVKVKKFV